MTLNIEKEVAAMRRLGVADLRRKFAEVFGEPTNTGNKPWLIKRIAWRMQANAQGGLAERARQRADELARDSDLRLSPPRDKTPASDKAPPPISLPPTRTRQSLPMPGSVITRLYKGRTLQVKVVHSGFEHEGEVYKSLSAVAKAITGTHCNGYLFFRLGKYGEFA